MSKVVTRRWMSDVASGLPRRDRASCDYGAYIPDALVGRPLTLDGDVAADVVDAERAIAQFEVRASALVDTEALARLLLRAESVASSKIEGKDVTATEVLNNIQAMQWALGTVGEGDAITIDVLLEAHRRLLAGSGMEGYGGHIREVQNWIGGSSYNPCTAAFVPPPPERVDALLDDLCAFSNSDHLPAIGQAAVAHAQFETIHPFVDGNGRIGRVLMHLILRRRGLTTHVVPPISLILATWADDYVHGLTGTRYVGSSRSVAAVAGINRWMALFATACRRAIEDASEFEERVAALQAQWRKSLGRIRSGSAVDLLIRALPGASIVTVKGAADLIGRTFQVTNQAVARLVEVGILVQVNVGHRNRAFEAPDTGRLLVDAYSESSLRSCRRSPLASGRGARRVEPSLPACERGSIAG
jgi:Fic family protein